jgi:DNA-binding NarL/FixJ family response regulator
MTTAPTTPPRLLLVEDQRTFRELLHVAIVSKFAPIDCAEAGSCREARAALKSGSIDVLVCDLYLPDGDGRGVIRDALSAPHPPRCLAITGEPDPHLAGDLLALGVAGFVDKSSPVEHVLLALSRVMAGGVFFSTHVPPPRPVKTANGSGGGPGMEVLTPREREIAQLAASGATSKEIGARLDISPRTVEKHRADLMRKLGLRDVASLVRWAIDRRLG